MQPWSYMETIIRPNSEMDFLHPQTKDLVLLQIQKCSRIPDGKENNDFIWNKEGGTCW